MNWPKWVLLFCLCVFGAAKQKLAFRNPLNITSVTLCLSPVVYLIMISLFFSFFFSDWSSDSLEYELKGQILSPGFSLCEKRAQSLSLSCKVFMHVLHLVPAVVKIYRISKLLCKCFGIGKSKCGLDMLIFPWQYGKFREHGSVCVFQPEVCVPIGWCDALHPNCPCSRRPKVGSFALEIFHK